MNLSVMDLFKLGIGPSSSHTVGPMLAAWRFTRALQGSSAFAAVDHVQVELFGSLAWTGKGHATDRAVIAGLGGAHPTTATRERIDAIVADVTTQSKLALDGARPIHFSASDILWRREETLPFHPNGMRFEARDAAGALIEAAIYYSVGGGFVVSEGEAKTGGDDASTGAAPKPFPFSSAAELLTHGREQGLSIAEMIASNEATLRSAADTAAGLDTIWTAMDECIARGLRTSGVLPGGLNVKRRAAEMHQRLSRATRTTSDLDALDWLNVYALAVNEENAAGGRVVTAPTNGAAGVIPAVLKYFTAFHESDRELIHRFLLTAGAIGMLYKHNASLSAAEMGCQGEVGVACSMAAAGLAAVFGGTNEQIENAAEIGMEHNLGLTCDPIKGLVQIPCIERNTMGAVKAVNAARLAVLHGDGTHHVSLDSVIKTMKQTGLDMRSQYKETSTGGLAVNVPDC